MAVVVALTASAAACFGSSLVIAYPNPKMR